MCRLSRHALLDGLTLKIWHDVMIQGRPLRLLSESGERQKMGVSIPHELQNDLTTGVKRETLPLDSEGANILRCSSQAHC